MFPLLRSMTSAVTSAQAYLNENHQADLSRVQCLLCKMLPEPYRKAITDLCEDQDPSVIYNIFGGVHQHAPNATKAEQKKYLR
ncbi:transcription-repair coupling factor [Parabacteroides sp.]